MTVSKRTRYEVLKRDNYTCRYCHATDKPLVVDHVTPVALGGTDSPSNLVAACRDCNSGKSSTAPDAALVEDVRQDALRHAELTKHAYAVLMERMGERDDYIETWRDAWTRPCLPPEWRNTIGRWFEMGVPVELLIDAAEIACAKTAINNDGRFPYMCGIVWGQVHAVDTVAEMHRHLDGSFMSEDALSEMRIDAYQTGRQAGYEIGVDDAHRVQARIDPLSRVVDRIAYPKLVLGVRV